MSRIMNHKDYPNFDEGESIEDAQERQIAATEKIAISAADSGVVFPVNVTVIPSGYDETDKDAADEALDRQLDEAFQGTYDAR